VVLRFEVENYLRAMGMDYSSCGDSEGSGSLPSGMA
jgi:hypothetical protein